MIIIKRRLSVCFQYRNCFTLVLISELSSFEIQEVPDFSGSVISGQAHYGTHPCPVRPSRQDHLSLLVKFLRLEQPVPNRNTFVLIKATGVPGGKAWLSQRPFLHHSEDTQRSGHTADAK